MDPERRLGFESDAHGLNKAHEELDAESLEKLHKQNKSVADQGAAQVPVQFVK